MKTKFCMISLLLALSLSAQAGIIYTYGDGTVNTAIPDNNTLGLTELLTINNITEPASISMVMLNFTLAGGFGTDLTGYLRLGNLSGSPSYSLTSLIQADPTISSGGVTFNVDVSSAFTGQDPNNTWTLFFADQSTGGTTTLNNGWSLDIEAVPEPVNMALGIFGGLMGVVVVARSFKKAKSLKAEIAL
jgi:hypothetical protein